MNYDGSIKIDTSLELSHLQQDILSLDGIFSRLLEAASVFGLRFIASGAQSAGKFASGVISAVASLPSRFAGIGGSIVSCFWSGVASLGGWLYARINSFFTGIVNSVKKKLGINSPSKVFRDMIGANMAKGVWAGFDSRSGEVQKNMADSLRKMTSRLRSAVSDASPAPSPAEYSSRSYSSYNSYDTKQIFNFNSPAVSPSQIARAARKASLVY